MMLTATNKERKPMNMLGTHPPAIRFFSNHFHSGKNDAFSSARSRDFDGMFGIVIDAVYCK
jgi:hypothetical protein